MSRVILYTDDLPGKNINRNVNKVVQAANFIDVLNDVQSQKDPFDVSEIS